MNKLNATGIWIAVMIGVGCNATVAEGAVTFFGSGARSPTTSPPTSFGVSVETQIRGDIVNAYSINYDYPSGLAFSQGLDIPSGATFVGLFFRIDGSLLIGAEFGDQNYANISILPFNSPKNSVAQFNFDRSGEDYLVAIASNADGSYLSISEGKALIDAAAAPEPSCLFLFVLGSVGLLARRQR